MYSYTLSSDLVVVEDLCVSYGDVKVLDKVNGRIPNVVRPGMRQGQVVSLLGPSGVGKSQLFLRLSGLRKPTSGRVLIGDPLTEVQAGMVGVVMQDYPLLEHRTVLDNLTVAGTLAGMGRKQAVDKAKALLDFFSLLPKAEDWPGTLSGGQRQRVAIAQQLMGEPMFLLMDEPFSGLDPVMLKAACQLIEEVSRIDEHRTIILVTHDVHAALTVSDLVWVLGRDTDVATGAKIPGARIQHVIDLKERGVAWRPDRHKLPAFQKVLDEVEAIFPSL